MGAEREELQDHHDEAEYREAVERHQLEGRNTQGRFDGKAPTPGQRQSRTDHVELGQTGVPERADRVLDQGGHDEGGSECRVKAVAAEPIDEGHPPERRGTAGSLASAQGLTSRSGRGRSGDRPWERCGAGP